jgi:hypothetical protein
VWPHAGPACSATEPRRRDGRLFAEVSELRTTEATGWECPRAGSSALNVLPPSARSSRLQEVHDPALFSSHKVRQYSRAFPREAMPNPTLN